MNTQQAIIQSSLQQILDAGESPEFIRGFIAAARRRYEGDKRMQSFLDDMTTRFITSLEGGDNDV